MNIIKILTGLFLVLAVLSCGTDTPSTESPDVEATILARLSSPTPWPPNKPTPIVSVDIMEIFTDHWGAATASVEERTYLADVVVRARLASAGDNVLRFRAVTYLKGTGPAKFSVSAPTSGRNTQWDNQDAILFLLENDGTEGFEFVDTTEWQYNEDEWVATTYTGDLPDGFTLGTNNPVWLPVTNTAGTSTARSVDSGDPRIQLESQGARIPRYTTESALRDTISWLVGPAGDSAARSSAASSPTPNTLEYNRCVTSALRYIRDMRDRIVYGDGLHVPGVRQRPVSLESGMAAGTEVIPFDHRFRGSAYYNFTVYEDPNGFFAANLTDDNTDPSDGYEYSVVTTRPIPSGRYKARHRIQPYFHQACDFAPEGIYTLIDATVTAPPGTIHEAFFDPATTTAGVGYLAGSATTTGVLEPAGFSMRGRDIDITGLEWRNGQVVLSFDRTVQLSDGLSFIETDGTAGLYLSQYDDTEDLRARTATWDVSEQPWESGDELMLRIGPIPLPGVRNLTAERGSGREVVLRWEVEYTAGVNGYRIWRHQPGRDEGPRIYVSDTLSTDTTFTDANSPVPNLTEYRVQAIDRIYNAGESSESVRVGSQ